MGFLIKKTDIPTTFFSYQATPNVDYLNIEDVLINNDKSTTGIVAEIEKAADDLSYLSFAANNFVGRSDFSKYIRGDDRPWMHSIPGYIDKNGYKLAYAECCSPLLSPPDATLSTSIPSGTYYIYKGGFYTESASASSFSKPLSTIYYPKGNSACLMAITGGGGGSSGGTVGYEGAGGGGAASCLFLLDLTKVAMIKVQLGSGGAGGEIGKSGEDGEDSYIWIYPEYGNFKKSVCISPYGGHSGEISGSTSTGGDPQPYVVITGSNDNGSSSDSDILMEGSIMSSFDGVTLDYKSYGVQSSYPYLKETTNSSDKSDTLVYILGVYSGRAGNSKQATTDTQPLGTLYFRLSASRLIAKFQATAKHSVATSGSNTGGSGGYSLLGIGGSGGTTYTTNKQNYGTAGLRGGGGGGPCYYLLGGLSGNSGGDGFCSLIYTSDGTNYYYNSSNTEISDSTATTLQPPTLSATLNTTNTGVQVTIYNPNDIDLEAQVTVTYTLSNGAVQKKTWKDTVKANSSDYPTSISIGVTFVLAAVNAYFVDAAEDTQASITVQGTATAESSTTT